MNKALLLSFVSTGVLASPSWYGEVTHNTELTYGYGQANSYQLAKDNAYQDLAQSIESRITSEVTTDKTFVDGELSKTVTSKKTSLTDVVFRNNVTISQSEQIDGTFYLKVQYDPTSFSQKLSQWLAKPECQSPLHPYWSKTAMFSNWVSQNHCLPHIEIERFAGGWQLTNDSGHLVLPEGQYNHLFFNSPSSSIELESTQARLKSGDHYFINLTSNTSGYLSLFQVYEDGSSGVLIENKPVEPGSNLQFPDNRLYDGIEALVVTGQGTYDTNIALLCPQKIDTSRFEKLDESPLSTDTPGFGLILNYLNQCDFAMERLSISK